MSCNSEIPCGIPAQSVVGRVFNEYVEDGEITGDEMTDLIEIARAVELSTSDLEAINQVMIGELENCAHLWRHQLARSRWHAFYSSIIIEPAPRTSVPEQAQPTAPQNEEASEPEGSSLEIRSAQCFIGAYMEGMGRDWFISACFDIVLSNQRNEAAIDMFLYYPYVYIVCENDHLTIR